MIELDPVIHAEARLRVIASLTALGEGNRISFPKLRKMLEMTAGNLSTHLRKLEDAGYILVDKKIEERTPATYIGITVKGRSAFHDYRSSLRAVLQGSDGPAPAGGGPGDGPAPAGGGPGDGPAPAGGGSIGRSPTSASNSGSRSPSDLKESS